MGIGGVGTSLDGGGQGYWKGLTVGVVGIGCGFEAFSYDLLRLI